MCDSLRLGYFEKLKDLFEEEGMGGKWNPQRRGKPSKITIGISIHGICEKRTRDGGNNTKTSKGYLKK